ncbi:MAG: 50S ribosomal protein L4, partial [Candidatus Bipolaricaulia bacterium]
KLRKKGLRMALTAKCWEGQLALMEEIHLNRPKTKEALRLLEGVGFDGKVLILVSREEDTMPVRKSFSNIPWAKCLPAGGANVYDLLKYEDLLVTKGALAELQERLCDGTS